MKRAGRALGIIAAALIVGIGGRVALAADQVPRAGQEVSPARTVLLSGLSDPWDLAFTPDGALYVAVDEGRIWRLSPGP